MASRSSMSMYGTATPYIALFDSSGVPIKNPLTNIPLGAYISKFSFKYDEEKENNCSLTFDTGNPDTIDIDAFKEGRTLNIQWGYIYSNGTSYSGPLRGLKIKDVNAVFDNLGTHITLKCIDATVELRTLPSHRPSAEDDDNDGVSSMADYLDRGCDIGLGIIIEKFNY